MIYCTSMKKTESAEPNMQQNETSAATESRLGIIIVNWNAGDFLYKCVESVLANTSRTETEIIVVDNGSTDRSTDFLIGHPEVALVCTKSNLGFAKACNIGAHRAKSEFLLFFNPDAELYENTITETLAFMDAPENSRTGICGVQLKDENEHISRSCSRFPTPLRLTAHAAGLDRIHPLLGTRMLEWQHDKTRIVDQLIGAFFLVRKTVFDELQGFDERFFVYYEEVDFSLRAKKVGWSSAYLTNAQAFHAGGGTSNQIKARRLFYSLRSRLVYAFKHFSPVGAWTVLLSTLLLEPLTRTGHALARGSWSAVKETWSGYAMLYRWLPQWVLRGSTR